MKPEELAPTHTVYTLKQTTKQSGRWLKLGSARLDNNGSIHVQLDVLPIGGFSGYLHCSPQCQRPPTIDPVVRRPGKNSDDLADDEA